MILKREKGEISKEEWIQCVESHPELIWEEDLNKLSKTNSYLDTYININGTNYYGLFYHGYHIDVKVEDQFLSRVLPVLNSVNKFLKTNFYKEDYFNKHKDAYTAEEIETLNSIGLKNKIDLSVRYHDYSFGEHSEWITLKTSDLKSVLNYFNVENYRLIEWDVVFMAHNRLPRKNDLFFFTYGGWTFITGELTKNLFPKNAQEYFDEMVSYLKTLSQKFEEVHYYTDWVKRYSYTGFFKFVDGHLLYGKYSSENTKYEKGIMPDILNSLTSIRAYNVASIWSLDPRYFVFEKELKDTKIIVF